MTINENIKYINEKTCEMSRNNAVCRKNIEGKKKFSSICEKFSNNAMWVCGSCVFARLGTRSG